MVWSTFIKGFWIGLGQLKMALIVYIIQLLLALTIGIQVYHVLDASIGNSLEVSKLIEGYDHTVVSDFLNVHGGSVTPLFGQIRWFILIYLLVGVFTNAGILGTVARNQKGWYAFWSNAALYFLPFLKISILIGAISLVWMFLTIGMSLTAFPGIIESLPSDRAYFFLLVGAFIIFLLGVGVLFVWSVASRLHYIREECSFFKSISGGIKLFFNNWSKSMLLLFLFVLFLGLICTAYFILSHFSGMVSPFLIIVFFAIQQGIVLFRTIWRIMLYGAMNSLF